MIVKDADEYKMTKKVPKTALLPMCPALWDCPFELASISHTERQ